MTVPCVDRVEVDGILRRILDDAREDLRGFERVVPRLRAQRAQDETDRAAGDERPRHSRGGRQNVISEQRRSAVPNVSASERPMIHSPSSAPVAQLDRASASGAEGRGFESLRARHISTPVVTIWGQSCGEFGRPATSRIARLRCQLTSRPFRSSSSVTFK